MRNIDRLIHNTRCDLHCSTSRIFHWLNDRKEIGDDRTKKTDRICDTNTDILSHISLCNAAYFVFHKAGNIRSIPSPKYRVIGQVSNETIVQIPDTFDDYDATWIPIDAKIEYDEKAKT
jgi:hypothetical protein